MEKEIAVRLQLRVECKSKVYCVWLVCGCHGEKGEGEGGHEGKPMQDSSCRSSVYNLGLASSIAMAGKHTRQSHVLCSSGPACKPAGRGTDGRAGQGRTGQGRAGGRWMCLT